MIRLLFRCSAEAGSCYRQEVGRGRKDPQTQRRPGYNMEVGKCGAALRSSTGPLRGSWGRLPLRYFGLLGLRNCCLSLPCPESFQLRGKTFTHLHIHSPTDFTFSILPIAYNSKSHLPSTLPKLITKILDFFLDFRNLHFNITTKTMSLEAEETLESGLLGIGLGSDSEDESTVTTNSNTKTEVVPECAVPATKADRTALSEEAFQELKKTYRVKVENGEVRMNFLLSLRFLHSLYYSVSRLQLQPQPPAPS